MTIEIIPGNQAWSTLRGNAEGRWPKRQSSDRLYPVATPKGRARFALHPTDKVFCIGSCFAREIERALGHLGFEVLSVVRDLPSSPRRTISDEGIFNKYNTATILNELRWALDPATPYSHDTLITAPGNLLQDYQLAGPDYSDEREPAQAFRTAINETFRTIRQADVVVITLGLSEVWYDHLTRLYLNRAPTESLVELSPGRFELHVLDYEETLRTLEALYTLLTARLPARFRLLVTVSPVPLLATFRDQDVFTANAYSKAVLRAAVERFTQGKANVDYFPSYEFVTLSNPTAVWGARDFRHVDEAFVEYIMASAMEHYTPNAPGVRESAAISRAMALYRGAFHAEAMAALEPLATHAGGLPSARALILRQAIRLKLAGRAKGLLLHALTFLRPKDLGDLWRLLFTPRRRLSRGAPAAPRATGYIEHWDGHHLSGWCLGEGGQAMVRLRMLVDGEAVAETVADLPRLDVAAVHGEACMRCGFRIPVGGIRPEGSVIRILDAATGVDLENSPFLATPTERSR